MPRRYSRCREKFMIAVRNLVVGEGDVRQRLRYAYKQINRIGESDVPPSLRDDWRWIVEQVTRLGGEVDSDGSVYKTAADNTLSRIKNSTGRKIAERIYKVHLSLQELEVT